MPHACLTMDPEFFEKLSITDFRAALVQLGCPQDKIDGMVATRLARENAASARGSNTNSPDFSVTPSQSLQGRVNAELPLKRRSRSRSVSSQTSSRHLHKRQKKSRKARKGKKKSAGKGKGGSRRSAQSESESDSSTTSGSEEASDSDKDCVTRSPSRSTRSASRRSSAQSTMASGGTSVEAAVTDFPQSPTSCPFCHGPWPGSPSAHLQRCYLALQPHATHQPSSDYPDHWEIDVTRAYGVCLRHREEHDAERQPPSERWPTTIDFDAIPSRLHKYQEEILDFALDPAGHPIFQRVRKLTVNGVMLRTPTGVAAAIEAAGCGYYGGQGHAAISVYLTSTGLRRRINSIPVAAIHPLSPLDFFAYVIVPYTSLLLITEDNPDLDEDGIWALYKASRNYGEAVFPDTDI